jgi:peroxiredoxin
MAINVGDDAPDFELPGTIGDKVRLSDYRGKKNVVLLFYPLDFSPVCSGEVPKWEQDIRKFRELGAEIFGLSTDSLYTHKAFAQSCGVKSYALLADFNPRGEVARKYGVWREKDNINERATVLIDRQGKVRYAHVNEIGKERDNTELLKTLQQLR